MAISVHEIITMPALWRRFALYFLVAIVAAATMVAIVSHQRLQLQREQMIHEGSLRLELTERTMERNLRHVVNDVRRIAGSRALLEFVADSNTVTRQRLEESFLNVEQHSLDYDQIRFIGTDGVERVRVNFNNGIPAVVPRSALQDKSDRYYVRAANKLPTDQVYLSPLDLNIERGALDRPHKPMIRAAIPVVNARGDRAGILVLNYAASTLLDEFQALMGKRAGQAMLLNRAGYWLYHPDKTLEWGFMSGEQQTFARLYPSVWKQLTTADRGLLQTEQGLFIYNTLRYSTVTGNPTSTDSAFTWKVVRRIPPQQLAFAPWKLVRRYPLIAAGGLTAIALSSALFAWLRTINKRNEKLLRRSEKRYRQLFESAPDGIFIADPDGRYTDVNRAGCDLLGYQAEEVIGKTILEFIPPEDTQRLLRSRKRLLRGETEVGEWSLRCSDGSYWPVEVSANMLSDGRWQGFVRDIRKRKESEYVMRLAATVFNATQEAILITDAEHRIIIVNRAYTEITGFAPTEVIGSTPLVHQSDRHGTEFYQHIQQSLNEVGQWQGEIWNRDKDGNEFPVWENISVVKDDNGEVINYVAIMTDIGELKDAERQLTDLAHRDSLTGLANRHVFHITLKQSIEHARRHNQKLALMFLDLDRFKLINDTLGHDAGDQLLKIIALRLKHSIRAEDIVARLGGDEFTILLEEVGSADNAAILAHKVIQAVTEPVVLNGREIVTSTSIGIGIYPDDADNAVDLARCADAAMYRAKSRGRHTFEFYTPELTVHAEERMSLENGLRQAIGEGQLELLYQPQVELHSGHLRGVEALLRWHHPLRGTLRPDEFLSIAEESRLIDRIGEWVIHQACNQARLWREAGLLHIRIAINVAGHQLMYDHTVETLNDALRANGLDATDAQLQLEITENLLHSGERVRKTLETLRDLGFGIAIDDFGTGYSSLSHLKHLPIDTLKVDSIFMSDVPDDRDNAAIVRAIVSMGHSLGMRIIAEGVEHLEQLTFLRMLGCDDAQGYFFSEPVTADRIEAMLQQNKSLLPGPQLSGQSVDCD